jgi:hypothetical protein
MPSSPLLPRLLQLKVEMLHARRRGLIEHVPKKKKKGPSSVLKRRGERRVERFIGAEQLL